MEISTFLQEATLRRHLQIVIKMSAPPTTACVLRTQRSSERPPSQEQRELLPSAGFVCIVIIAESR